MESLKILFLNAMNCLNLNPANIVIRAPRTWSKRMADLQSSWEESRSTLFEILLGVECLPEDASCSICFENPASIRCHHCGNSQLLCHQCDRLRHTTNPFHDREAWFEKCFKPVQSCQTVDEVGFVHACV